LNGVFWHKYGYKQPRIDSDRIWESANNCTFSNGADDVTEICEVSLNTDWNKVTVFFKVILST